MPRSAFYLACFGLRHAKMFLDRERECVAADADCRGEAGMRRVTMAIFVVDLPTSIMSAVDSSPRGRSARDDANVSPSNACTLIFAMSNTESASSMMRRAKPMPVTSASPRSPCPTLTMSNTVSGGGRGTSLVKMLLYRDAPFRYACPGNRRFKEIRF